MPATAVAAPLRFGIRVLSISFPLRAGNSFASNGFLRDLDLASHDHPGLTKP